MTLLDAAYWVTCVVLVVSGITKLGAPAATDRTLVALGLPVPPNTGRLLGALEVLLGAAGLVAAGPVSSVVAAVVAVTYLGFAAMVLMAMRRGLDDCGCIGVSRRSPTWGHVLVNGASAAVAGAASAVGTVDLGSGLSGLGTGWAVVVAVAVAAAAGALVALPGA